VISLVAGAFVMQSPFAQADNKTLNKAGWRKAAPTESNLTILPEAEQNALEIGVSGKIVHGFMENADDATRGELVLRAAVQLGPLAVELGMSVEDLISRALNKDFEDNGDSYSNGVTTVRARDLIEKAVATITVAQLTNSKNGEKTTVCNVQLFAGRDNASPLGSFTTDASPSVSILEHRSLAQQDLIGVRASVMKNTVIEIINFGYDWFGYQEDGAGERFAGVDPDAEDNIAVNIRHKVADMLGDGNSVEVYLSYAHMNDQTQFMRATAGDQPGENEVFAAGVQAQVDQMTISLEAFAMRPDSSSADDETGLRAAVSKEGDSVSPYASVEVLNRDGNVDKVFSVGLATEILDGITGTIQLSYVDPDSGDESVNIYIGAALNEQSRRNVASDRRSE